MEFKGFSEVYEKFQDADPYLERIQFDDPIRLDRETLDDIIYHHQCHVPYENIDVFYFNKEIKLDNASLFDKIVRRRRGGYCFEVNGCFFSLIYTLGFDAYPCFCRLVKNNYVVTPVRHRGTIIELDGRKWFTDVGYGGKSYPGALLLEDGHHQIKNGEEFWTEQINEYWWLIKRKSSRFPEGFCEIMVGTQPQVLCDYLDGNISTSMAPDSHFRLHRRANIRHSTGYYNILDDTFTIFDGPNVTKKHMDSTSEIQEIYRKYFGIEVELPDVQVQDPMESLVL